MCDDPIPVNPQAEEVHYLPPKLSEKIKGKGQAGAHMTTDIWSFGIIVGEILDL